MTEATARLRVRRGTADEPSPRYQEFAVPFEVGMTVLDALIWIRTRRDPSLAIRYSCINANVCKECLIAIDGVVGYACTIRLLRRCSDDLGAASRQTDSARSRHRDPLAARAAGVILHCNFSEARRRYYGGG